MSFRFSPGIGSFISPASVLTNFLSSLCFIDPHLPPSRVPRLSFSPQSFACSGKQAGISRSSGSCGGLGFREPLTFHPNRLCVQSSNRSQNTYSLKPETFSFNNFTSASQHSVRFSLHLFLSSSPAHTGFSRGSFLPHGLFCCVPSRRVFAWSFD